ncbi:hypothetical protein GE21DRAFT_1222523, partial [Neurospora crassa]
YLKYFELILKFFKDINLNIAIKKSFIAYLSVYLLGYYINRLNIIIITDRIIVIRNI